MTPALDQLTGPVTDVNTRGEGVLCQLSPISGIFAWGADLEATECSKGRHGYCREANPHGMGEGSAQAAKEDQCETGDSPV